MRTCISGKSCDQRRADPREIRLFFTLDLGISGNELGDTAGYDPKTGAVVHYKGARYFLAGAWPWRGKG